MHHREYPPPAPLRDVVACFWHLRRGQDAAPFEVMPDGYAEIVFHAGGPFALAGPGGWRPLPSPFLMGLLDGPARLRADGPVDILGIRCFPWTVYELLGLPSGTGSAALDTHPLAVLQHDVAAGLVAGRPADAIAAASAHFLAARTAVDALLARAGGAIRDAGGTLPVGQVAAGAHATVRTLERRFKRASGRTVKDVSSLVRFEQARNRLWTDPDTPLAALAQELGYADQSHLNRAFRRYAGMTPAVFAQRRRARAP
ncbi:helix-turn-helix domain-containing protein [uncultured Massilia sp.]|uniref:AraC family transcriptional regulator n=1 Tax=uncultured Massilia sp. TaxID=169973 RepID=UPI0025D90355|nr:helix-turn-helix domain-containing protein [uncultured Massilia sp.]